MKINTPTHSVEVVDGTLKLQAVSRHLTVVKIGPEGTAVEAVPYSKLGPRFAATPVLAATWAGDRYANVDLDCGAQRWRGTKSLVWVRSGLYNAGFDKRQVDSLFRQMRKVGPQDYVTSYRF
jgi:hypothetical protein